jgi:ribonuclease HI
MTGNLFETPPSTQAWFTAHCDGGSRGNPGPSGYGAVIEGPDGEIAARLSRFLGVQTNNYAEYQGLLAVLEWAVENGARHLRVVSDSELMVNQMKGRYKVASPVLRPLWEEAKRRAARLDRFEITHTLRGGNKEADRLANEAMDKGSKSAGQRVSGSASQQGCEAGSAGGARANAYERRPSGSASQQVREPARTTQVLDGIVKGGVIHLLNGELAEGARVKVIQE